MKNYNKGFTVLEFLVVIGMMMILVALVLVGLTAARKRANDNNSVSKLRTVALALEQYHDVCRAYPGSLDATETCGALGNKTLEAFIPDIASFVSDPDYVYVPLASQGTTGPCIGYHLGVKLKTDGYQQERANFKIVDDHTLDICGSGTDFDPGMPGDPEYYFDIHR